MRQSDSSEATFLARAKIIKVGDIIWEAYYDMTTERTSYCIGLIIARDRVELDLDAHCDVLWSYGQYEHKIPVYCLSTLDEWWAQNFESP